jgi:hypothetical protein
MTGNVASIYDNGGMIGATLDLGSTEQYITGSTGGTPSIVGTASANGASSVSLTGITGLAEGDLVLVFASEDNSTTSASITSSGWTSLVNGAFINNIEHSIAYKVMGATVDTSVSIASTIDAITVIALRNVEYTARSGFVSNGFTNSATIDPASITATDSDSVVLVLSAIDDDSSTISSPSTGYTTAVQDGRVGGSNAIMYKTGVSAGTEDPDTVTWSSNDAIIAYTLVLSPTSSVTYGNYKNSGIWSMDAVYELLKPLPVGLYASGSDTATALSDGFTFPFSASSGNIVLAFSSRTSGGVNSFSVSDSAGNTYTRVIEETQSNGLTVAAIFVSTLTSPVVSGSTTLTITTTGADTEEAGVGFFHIGDYSSTPTSSSQPTPTATLSESVTMSTGGLVFHVIATGLTSPPTGLSSSTGFTKLLENAQTGSSTYVFYDNSGSTGTVTNTVAITSGNWSSAMAGFE